MWCNITVGFVELIDGLTKADTEIQTSELNQNEVIHTLITYNIDPTDTQATE